MMLYIWSLLPQYITYIFHWNYKLIYNLKLQICKQWNHLCFWNTHFKCRKCTNFRYKNEAHDFRIQQHRPHWTVLIGITVSYSWVRTVSGIKLTFCSVHTRGQKTPPTTHHHSPAPSCQSCHPWARQHPSCCHRCCCRHPAGRQSSVT